MIRDEPDSSVCAQHRVARATESSILGILMRAEHSMAVAGERLLVERLHQVLDEGGTSALTTFSSTLLPHVQTLVTLLPQLLHDDAPDTARDAVRLLGTTLQSSGTSLADMIAEGVRVHDRLLLEVSSHLRENDRAVVIAVAQLSRALLAIGQDALLAYHERATAELAQLAHSDSLTGLANRRYFDERFAEELLRAQRVNRTLSLILIDVNNLKVINDSEGHAAGDDALRHIARVLQAQSRGIDLAARIGGDEFALLLPETDRIGSETLLLRLHEGAAQHASGQGASDFSAGVAVYPDDGRTTTELMAVADHSLYGDKRRRR